MGYESGSQASNALTFSEELCHAILGDRVTLSLNVIKQSTLSNKKGISSSRTVRNAQKVSPFANQVKFENQ